MPSLLSIKGVGRKTQEELKKLGIGSVEELLHYFPRTYQDRTHIKKIFELEDGKRETFEGKVTAYREKRFFRKGVCLNEVIVYDGTGFAHLLFFNQPQIIHYLPIGTRLIVSGRVYRRRKIEIQDFEYEVLQKKEKIHTTRIVPIYPLGAGIDKKFQRKLRSIMREAILQYAKEIKDFLPPSIRERQKLLPLGDAIGQIHFPYSSIALKNAKKRLIFDELFLMQLALGIVKQQRERGEGIRYNVNVSLPEEFIRSLPFSLTSEQQKVIEEIKEDMSKPFPMYRLLHGEVGAGKTIVALFAALIACANGYQVAFMAPTEVLAEQHFINLSEYLLRFSLNICCLTGGMKKSEKTKILSKIKEGEIHIVIGTHALLQEEVRFHALGLCIIDEQHRFGVLQRKTLMEKGKVPDTLIMTATPIPRTLALACYGDLEVSVLSSLPPGRKPAKTFCFSYKESRKVYKFVKEKLREQSLVYFVYPQLEEEEGLRTAKGSFGLLQKEFHPYKVALLHGRMQAAEKKAVIEAFKKGEIQLLCCTTVVEVGLDVEEACVIVIEEAHRFGLLQLHQLRGRVQRGKKQGYCILLCPEHIKRIVDGKCKGEKEEEKIGAKRISVLLSTSDGFKIAEEDMYLRGPGELFGVLQHGTGRLQIADIIKHEKLLLLAKKEAEMILKEDPLLQRPSHALLKEELIREYKEVLQFAKVG